MPFALIGEPMADPLTEAEARFRALRSYRLIAHSLSAEGDEQVLRYFYCKPGWVRIELVRPHRGVLLIHDPTARKVRLWPFGLGFSPPLSLAPDNPLVLSPRGHRIDRSDVGALLENMRALLGRGTLVSLGDAQIAARSAAGLEITGANAADVAGVHRYRVWLSHDTFFPLRVQSYAVSGTLIETVDMADAEIDVRFPEHFFTP